MATNRYTEGSTVFLTATFKDLSAVVADPSTIIFYVWKPDGTIDTFTYGTDAVVTKVSTGVYRLQYATTINTSPIGTYRYGAKGVISTVTILEQDGKFELENLRQL